MTLRQKLIVSKQKTTVHMHTHQKHIELGSEIGRGAAVSIVQQDGWKNWSCQAAGMSAELMQRQSVFTVYL